jgi:hypothetical protein
MAEPLSEGERLRAAIRAETELALTETAFDGLRTAMINELIASDYDQSAQREHLYHGLRAMRDVRKTLTDMVKVGTDIRAMREAAAQGAKAIADAARAS